MSTETNHAGEFLLSQANGDRSFEKVVLAAGNNLQAGTVLGKITASGKYSPYNDANIDGTETAAAILYDNVDTSVSGTNADTDVAVVSRDATVAADSLVGSDVAGVTDLAAIGIIVRS